MMVRQHFHLDGFAATEQCCSKKQRRCSRKRHRRNKKRLSCLRGNCGRLKQGMSLVKARSTLPAYIPLRDAYKAHEPSVPRAFGRNIAPPWIFSSMPSSYTEMSHDVLMYNTIGELYSRLVSSLPSIITELRLKQTPKKILCIKLQLYHSF